MSKSLGNAIEPAEISNKWGADLLRLWVTSVEYQADVKMSERVMTQLSEAYRKIRNTFRFALGNLGDFDPSRNSLPNEQSKKWIGGCSSVPPSSLENAASGMPGMNFTACITQFMITAWWT